MDAYTHDPGAFTQGLAIAEGALYESTGLYGESSLRRVDLATGDVLQLRTLPDSLFGDGSSTLFFMDPNSFVELGRVAVYDNDGPVALLNELEYIGGEVFANILQSDRIARIDPESGKVTGWIDLSGLLAEVQGSSAAGVLNGIAYDEAGNRLYVTGKNWPQLFQIELR